MAKVCSESPKMDFERRTAFSHQVGVDFCHGEERGPIGEAMHHKQGEETQIQKTKTWSKIGAVLWLKNEASKSEASHCDDEFRDPRLGSGIWT